MRNAPQCLSAWWGGGRQAWRGGPRGAAARWWAPLTGAASGGHGGASDRSCVAAKKAVAGGGARPPCESRHRGQWPPARLPGAGWSAPCAAPASAARSSDPSGARVRGPLLVQTSRPWPGPCVAASACVSVGESVANAISHTASQARKRTLRRAKSRVAGMAGKRIGKWAQRAGRVGARPLVA